MSVALENRTTYLYTNLVNLKMIVLKMHLKLIYLLLNNNMQHKQGKKQVKWNILLYFDDFFKNKYTSRKHIVFIPVTNVKTKHQFI